MEMIENGQLLFLTLFWFAVNPTSWHISKNGNEKIA